jgi:hypothetical protein
MPVDARDPRTTSRGQVICFDAEVTDEFHKQFHIVAEMPHRQISCVGDGPVRVFDDAKCMAVGWPMRIEQRPGTIR